MSSEVDAGPGSDGEDDFDDRQLCADGACTGVLGPDGRCRECGRSSAGAVPQHSDEARSDDPLPADSEGPALDDDDDEDWRLCPDGSCVGLIGADGRCKVCGRTEDEPVG